MPVETGRHCTRPRWSTCGKALNERYDPQARIPGRRAVLFHRRETRRKGARMRTAVRPFLLTCCLLFFSVPVAWSETISGRIVDPDGRVVSGATVIVIDGGSVVATAVTDATGVFTIQTSQTGPFDLRASAEG